MVAQSEVVTHLLELAMEDLAKARRTLEVAHQAAKNEADDRQGSIFWSLDNCESSIQRIDGVRLGFEA